jgi:hypothetical protein
MEGLGFSYFLFYVSEIPSSFFEYHLYVLCDPVMF